MKPRMSALIAAAVLLTLLVGLVGGAQPAQALEKTAKSNILRASVKLATPFDADPQAGSTCSGTMLNQQGYILSNFHCIGYVKDGQRDKTLESMGLRPGDLYNKKGLSAIAITDDPRQLPVPTYIAQVIAADPVLDISVLKIVAYYNSKQKLPATLPVVSMPLADSDAVETLDEVYVVGYPGIAGDSVTATEGKISGFLDEDQDGQFDWFKTDVLVNQGNSGGSAVNDNGELIGIPTLLLRDERGNVIYLLRPVNLAVPLIQKALKAGGSSTDLEQGTTTPAPVPSGQNFGTITFGAGFDNAKGITGAATTFPSGVTEVHAGVPYDNLRNGAAWGYQWQLDGQDVTGQESLKWTFGASGVLDLYLKGKNGLTDGAYNLQVFLKGALAQEGQFVVGTAGGAVTPQKPPAQESEGVTITGTILAHSTQRPIQGAIIVFLYPGKTVDEFDNDDSDGKADTVFSYGVTNAQGQFTINTPLPRGYVYSAIVGAKGYQRIAEDDALEITEDDPDVIELDTLELDR